jgi:hypothetical protein
MSVGPVGNAGDGGTLAMLYKQLVRDEQRLVKDATSHAAKEVLALDQAQVAADQSEIMQAQQRQLFEQQQAQLAAAHIDRPNAGAAARTGGIRPN